MQLHDVTGKVQRARLIIAAQMREVRVAALDAHLNLKIINLVEKKNKPRFRVNRIPWAGVKDPLFLGTGYL